MNITLYTSLALISTALKDTEQVAEMWTQWATLPAVSVMAAAEALAILLYVIDISFNRKDWVWIAPW